VGLLIIKEKIILQYMTQIGIVDDNPALVKSMVMLLEGSGQYQVVLQEYNCKKIMESISNSMPQLLLMDIDMPGINGIEAVSIIKAAFPAVNIVMFTSFEDEHKIFKSLMAGASGYILKKTPSQKILDSLQDIKDGGAAMSPAIAQKVIEMFTRQRKASQQNYHLSNREIEILNNLVKGFTYKNIAQEMNISVETVRSHLKNIYEKLHVNSKSEAVAVALKEKII
jgi:DNA-binding NarL/FixJ family response regulator